MFSFHWSQRKEPKVLDTQTGKVYLVLRGSSCILPSFCLLETIQEIEVVLANVSFRALHFTATTKYFLLQIGSWHVSTEALGPMANQRAGPAPF